MNEPQRHPNVVPSRADMRLIVTASTAGTIFEWYDFFIYGTLSAIIGKTFFPAGNATLQTLLVWATFAVGFGFRPFGAVLFGWFGDRLGRKYTFLVTVTLMGLATAAVYIAEHAPAETRGRTTGWIQTSAMGGFILSIVVVLTCKAAMSPADWAAWGWRVPFLLSVLLLAISLWMRLKLSESPVFRAMKEEGTVSGNPFIESLTYPGNLKRLFVAMLGSAAGMTVIYYTALFYMLTFLKGPLRVDDTVAEAMVGIAAFIATLVFQPIGAWSDKVGRKLPLVLGYVGALVLLVPAFHAIGNAANPRLAEAAARAPVVVEGPDCHFDTFASEQATPCGKLLADMTTLGVTYRPRIGPVVALSAGGQPVSLAAYPWGDKAARGKALGKLLAPYGYDLGKVKPPLSAQLTIIAWITAMSIALGLTYGGMAAQLAEMFPARIRYSSMSIPYHVGTGYFGGFLPLIASYMVARSGDPYAGLWYTAAVVAAALLVTLWGAEGGPPRDFVENA